MGLFKSLKGDHPDTIGSDIQEAGKSQSQSVASPPGPPPHQATRPLSGPSSGDAEYHPPPGPPPPRQPKALQFGDSSSQRQTGQDPPAYHDWTIIPDTALLPPPPSLGYETSPTSNANVDEADRAHEWCKQNPLVKPHQPTPAQCAAVSSGNVSFWIPAEYQGHLKMSSVGTWRGSTRAGSNDSCLITSSPLYFAFSDSPRVTGIKKTIYFEVKLRSLSRGQAGNESSLALGFCALPYPTWRLPGWERGSLAVHSDDGHKYVNNTWGGKEFTVPFKIGDTVGLGISFSTPDSPPSYGVSPQAATTLKADVFFTRNGTLEGGWDLHEELDASNDLGVDGLDGQFDLYGAVGIFGGVEFDCLFHRPDWLWLPR